MVKMKARRSYKTRSSAIKEMLDWRKAFPKDTFYVQRTNRDRQFPFEIVRITKIAGKIKKFFSGTW